MRVSRLLSGTGLVTTLAALMPGVASADVIQIDESIEGQAPTVTSDFAGFGSVSVTDLNLSGGLEGWTINFTITAPGTIGSSIVGAEGGLYEPGTGKTQLSDELQFNTSSLLAGEGGASFTYTLISDSDTGGLSTFICSQGGVTCLEEDGTFQTLSHITIDFVTGLPLGLDLQVKSDLDPVPEPGPLSLLAAGLGAYGLLRRRKNKTV